MSITQSLMDFVPRLQALSAALHSVSSDVGKNSDTLNRLQNEIQLTENLSSQIYNVLTRKTIFDFQQQSDFSLSQATTAYLNQAIVQSVIANGLLESLTIPGLLYTLQQFQFSMLKYVIVPDAVAYVASLQPANANPTTPNPFESDTANADIRTMLQERATPLSSASSNIDLPDNTVFTPTMARFDQLPSLSINSVRQ